MEPQKQKQKITVIQAIIIKIAQNIHDSTFGEILRFLGGVIIVLALTYLLTFPRHAWATLSTFFQLKNLIVPKFILSVVLVRSFPKIYKFIKSKKPRYETVDENQIEGIPTVELIDHLFETQSFKRGDVEYKFNIPRNRYQRLAEKLESNGVLVRGENNSRILNEEVRRQDIVKMLEGAESSCEIQNYIKKDKNHYSFKPTPIFTTKNIA